MTPERLLACYDKVADAPDAVARLRRFVLDLAVHGKLVAQDPRDEPASELLQRIAAEKARLVKAGEIRKSKALAVLDQDEVPFPLPRGWVWSQIGELGVISPRNDVPNDRLTSFVPMPMIAAEYGVPNGHEIRAWSEIKKGYTHFAEGDVGLAKITPCFENGKSTVFRNLTGGAGSGTTELHIVRPLLVSADYILLFLKSPYFIDTGIPRMTGTAGQKRIPTEYFISSPFPLPPLAEQHRIVAKVDELMALCDRLEAARAGREGCRDRLTAAGLARLDRPDPDAAAFRGHAARALETIPSLTERPDQIKALRRTILNLAVRGQFSQKQSNATQFSTLKQYRKLQNGYAFKSSWFSKKGIRLLRNANIGHGIIRWNETVYLPEDRIREFEQFMLTEGDIVLTLDRPFIATGTKVTRVTRSDIPSLLLQRVGRFYETAPGLADDYLLIWIKSPHFNEQIDPGRSNGVPHISSKQVEAAQIFVPPLAEQRRIVARVDELMALCDRLEACLDRSADLRRRLLDALLHAALAPGPARLEAVA